MTGGHEPDRSPVPTPTGAGTTPGAIPSPPPPGLRARACLAAASGLSGLSRRANMGSGSVIGGQFAVAVYRGLLSELSARRRVAVVSGTNGKTTTNRFIAEALRTLGAVATNADGANMDAGMVVALGDDRHAGLAALECDELWLPGILTQLPPSVVVLLNLSRDQLDRTQEVRSIADAWRSALGDCATRAVVANADDPLVVWAALGCTSGAPRDTEGDTGGDAGGIVWVGTGAWWTLDAAGCPQCAGRIEFGPGNHWACTSCGFRRPEPSLWLDGDHLKGTDGTDVALELVLPGRANRANAAMAAAAARCFGVQPEAAVAAMGTVADVAGRYRTETVGGVPVRLLLAKNPAGWREALEMVAGSDAPAVVSINARIADGRDPSWLWDVPFEDLRGRFVVASGERRHDLAVRLAYAEVDHTVAGSLAGAVAAVADHDASNSAGGSGTQRQPIDVIGNYTALQDHLGEVDP